MTQRNPQQSTTLARREEGSNLASWTPRNQMAELHRQMDELFGQTFGYTPLSQMIPSVPGMWEPEVDIFETEDKVQIFAALPGYAPDQINVEATSDTLRLYGERKPFVEDEKAVPHRRSWHSGYSRFSATYSLPTEIDPNKVKATFHNGILQLELNKTEQARTKAVKVNIAGS